MLQQKKPSHNPRIEVGFPSHGSQSSTISHDCKICSKCIAVKSHFVLENISTQEIYLEYCSRTEMLADVITKLLDHILFT